MLAVDPGGTTGWVLVEDDGSGAVPRLVLWGEQPDQQVLLDMMWGMLQDALVDELVVERWVPVHGRPMTNEPSALEIIGALKWMAGYSGVVIIMQGAADAKAFGHADRMRPYDVGRGGGGHAKMAMRHALLRSGTRSPLRWRMGAEGDGE